MDILRMYWDRIPRQFRTIINVVAGSAFAALVNYLVVVVGGATFDINLAINAVLTAVGTALARALNPLDDGYGLGSEPAPVEDEVIDLEIEG